jgi:hypothetical protein
MEQLLTEGYLGKIVAYAIEASHQQQDLLRIFGVYFDLRYQPHLSIPALSTLL